MMILLSWMGQLRTLQKAMQTTISFSLRSPRHKQQPPQAQRLHMTTRARGQQKQSLRAPGNGGKQLRLAAEVQDAEPLTLLQRPRIYRMLGHLVSKDAFGSSL